MFKKETSVYLLAGTEQYLKEEKLAEIKSTFLDRKFAEFNFNIFYASSTSIKDVLECLRTLPFLGRKRVVLLRQSEELPAAAREFIIAYIKAPNTHNLLILETAETNLNQTFFREVCKYAQLIFCQPLKDNRLFAWMRLQAQARGKKKIEDKATQLLIDNLGNDLYLLINSLESLILYVGEKQTIKVEDVERLVGPDITASSFELFDAINMGDKEKTFQILDSLFKDRVNFSQILGALAYKFISEEGRKNPLLLRYWLENLQKTDSDIKTGKQDQRLALELLVVRLMSTSLSKR